MTSLSGTLLIVGALFLSFWLSEKLKTNMGIIAMFFALVIGALYGISYSQVFSSFPISITMTFILGPIFFGYVKRAGVFEKLSKNIISLFGKHSSMFPIAVFIAAVMLCACGGQTSIGFVIGAIAFPIAFKIGCSPLIIAVALWSAQTNFPWLDTSAVSRELISQVSPALVDKGLISIFFTDSIIDYGFFFVVYFVFKGHKISYAEKLNLASEKYTAKEKKVLTVLLLFIFMAVVPLFLNLLFPSTVFAKITSYANIYVLFTVGILIFSLMDIEPASIVIKEDVPWNIVILLAGTTMLLGLLNKVGAIQLISDWLVLSVPQRLIIPMILFGGGVLTMFTNGLVATQTLFPICVAVAESLNIPFLTAYTANKVGTAGPSISPFSGSGASCLVMCENEHKQELSKQLFTCAFILLAIQTLLGFTNFYGMFQ